MVFETRESISFGGSIAPGSSNKRIYQTNGDATVEMIKIVTFPGQEQQLHITPQIRETGSERVRNLVQGDGTFSGDGEIFEIDMSKPIKDNEELVLKVENQDSSYEYGYRFVASVDYRNGLEGLIMGAIGRLV